MKTCESLWYEEEYVEAEISRWVLILQNKGIISCI